MSRGQIVKVVHVNPDRYRTCSICAERQPVIQIYAQNRYEFDNKTSRTLLELCDACGKGHAAEITRGLDER